MYIISYTKHKLSAVTNKVVSGVRTYDNILRPVVLTIIMNFCYFNYGNIQEMLIILFVSI